MIKRAILGAGACAALFATQAQAAPLEKGEFALGLGGGAEFSLDGDVHGGATAPVASLRALNPNLPAAAAELRIQSRSFDRIYGEAMRLEAEGTFGLGSNREGFVALRYAHADEGRTQVGTAFVPALNASLPVEGTFGDYKSTSFEAGLRQYFGESALRPYVAGRVGLNNIKSIKASFVVPVPTGVGSEPNDIVLSKVPFYGGTTTWTAGVDLGVSYDLSESATLMAEAGLRYHGDLDGDDSAIGGLGLGAINNGSDRLAGSLGLRVRMRF